MSFGSDVPDPTDLALPVYHPPRSPRPARNALRDGETGNRTSDQDPKTALQGSEHLPEIIPGPRDPLPHCHPPVRAGRPLHHDVVLKVPNTFQTSVECSGASIEVHGTTTPDDTWSNPNLEVPMPGPCVLSTSWDSFRECPGVRSLPGPPTERFATADGRGSSVRRTEEARMGQMARWPDSHYSFPNISTVFPQHLHASASFVCLHLPTSPVLENPRTLLAAFLAPRPERPSSQPGRRPLGTDATKQESITQTLHVCHMPYKYADQLGADQLGWCQGGQCAHIFQSHGVYG